VAKEEVFLFGFDPEMNERDTLSSHFPLVHSSSFVLIHFSLLMLHRFVRKFQSGSNVVTTRYCNLIRIC